MKKLHNQGDLRRLENALMIPRFVRSLKELVYINGEKMIIGRTWRREENRFNVYVDLYH